MANNNIFISYNENIQGSVEIAKQLSKFFNIWERKCQLVKYSKGRDAPRNTIKKFLKSSEYLLQLFTADSEISQWMRYERTIFEAINEDSKLDEKIKILYTSQTDITSDLFVEFHALRKEGLLSFIQIDDEERSQNMLSTIIFDGYYKGETGAICLPACCKPKKYSKIHNIDAGIDRTRLYEVEDYIKNFRAANKRGLKSVYSNKESAMEEIKRKIEEIKKGDTVRMIGFTLNRYVHPSNNIGKDFEAAIRDREAKAKLLLLNRECTAAKERMKIESPEDYGKNKESTIFYKDSKAVESYYSEKEFYNGKIEIQYYKTPYSGIVIFDDTIYVEIYHLGDDGESDGKEKTICGRVPVMVVKRDTPFYKIFESHFERVWGESGA